MGGWDGFVERFAAKPAADLCLADPAVAQDHELDVPDRNVVASEV
jgi:hypothetical protein